MRPVVDPISQMRQEVTLFVWITVGRNLVHFFVLLGG